MRMWTFALAMALLLTLVVSPGTIRAATITVTNTNDSGPGSFRQEAGITTAVGGNTKGIRYRLYTHQQATDKRRYK